MAVLVASLMLTAVVGFLVGKEYDRSIKRINYNRRLRRAEHEKARLQHELEVEREKKAFINSIYHRNPNCKGVY